MLLAVVAWRQFEYSTKFPKIIKNKLSTLQKYIRIEGLRWFLHQHSCLKSTCIVFPFSSVQISSSTVSQISTELQFCCPDPITEFWSHIWSSTILQLQLQSTPRIHCLKLNPASMASFWVENVSFVHFKKDSCRRKVKFRMSIKIR